MVIRVIERLLSRVLSPAKPKMGLTIEIAQQMREEAEAAAAISLPLERQREAKPELEENSGIRKI